MERRRRTKSDPWTSAWSSVQVCALKKWMCLKGSARSARERILPTWGSATALCYGRHTTMFYDLYTAGRVSKRRYKEREEQITQMDIYESILNTGR